MKKTLATFMLISASLMAGASNPGEKNMGAYLFTFFNDATHSLFMATSHDGYEFTAVNNGNPVIAGDSISEQHGIRDPHIYRGPDNKFYMVMTDLHIYAQRDGIRDTEWERPAEYGWGNNRGIVLMKSDDLVNWSHNVVRIDKLFPDKYGDVGCFWAPETIYDPEEGKMMVYFTLRERGEKLEGGDPKTKKTRLYYAYTDPEFTTFVSEPKELFVYPNENIQILDADIMPMPDGRYFMTYCAQEHPGGVKYAISDRLNGGYQYFGEWIDTEKGSCEAPTTWKRIGEDKWVVMYDIFSINPHNFGFVETLDFKTFTPLGRFNEGVMKATNFKSPKHGAVIQITEEEASRLENHFKRRHKFHFDAENPDVHDPVLAYEDGRYYLFNTGMGIGVISSDDLKTWRQEERVLDSAPEWAKTPVPAYMGHTWAPDIIKVGDTWYLYYSCSTFGKNISAIGVAANKTLSPESPDFKWTDLGMVIQSQPGDNDWNAIDPNVIMDKKGNPWMTFGSFWDGIQLVKLKKDMKTPSGKSKTIARKRRPCDIGHNQPEAGANAIEGPFITERDGWYYLFVSHDYCCKGLKSDYKTVVGRSKKIEGPYVDRDGRDMAHGGGTLLIGPNESYAGVGHCSVYNFGDQWLFAAHGYDKSKNGASKLVLRPITWDDEGWPSID